MADLCSPADSFVYPADWTPDTVSKTMKAVNGTDCKFSPPGRKTQSVYAISFQGSSYERLKEDRAGIINDLALSDSLIQDALSFAEEVKVSETKLEGQDYVYFDIVTGNNEGILVAVTCDGSRLYALFCTGASTAADSPARLVRDSLRSLRKTVGVA